MHPSNFGDKLRNITFKQGFVEYLIFSWENQEMAHFCGNKVLYVNFIISSYKYQVKEGNVVKTMQLSLSSNHEEADTNMTFHVCIFQDLQPPYTGNIRCSDTDVLVIILGNMEFVTEEVEVWMDVVTGKSQRSIYLNKLYEPLGEK